MERIEGGLAWVLCRPATCRPCDEGRGCGGGIFARLFAGRALHLGVANRLDARPGETVVLGMDERRLLVVAMRLYGIPTIALLAGAASGAVVAGSNQDLAVLVGGLAGLGLALWREYRRSRLAPEPVLLRRCLKSD